MAAIILILLEGGLGGDLVKVVWGGQTDLAQITESNPNPISPVSPKSVNDAR